MRIDPDQAMTLLQKGGIVALPTETVYGLAASLHHPEAVERVFLLKRRPLKNPLIVHLADPEQLAQWVVSLPPDSQKLMRAFWPGALTLILPITPEKIDARVRAHLPTAAFRVPSHLIVRGIIEKAGPIVMPSANLSGSPSATHPEHVERDFGNHFPVVDGGECHEGLESTILHFLEGFWQILRLGALSAEVFVPVLGYLPQFHVSTQADPISPGQLYRHYAPRAELLLGKKCFVQGVDAIIGFSDRAYPEGVPLYALGLSGEVRECAHHLYHVLRQVDLDERQVVWVDVGFPEVGLWKTILERLERASKPPS